MNFFKGQLIFRVIFAFMVAFYPDNIQLHFNEFCLFLRFDASYSTALTVL